MLQESPQEALLNASARGHLDVVKLITSSNSCNVNANALLKYDRLLLNADWPQGAASDLQARREGGPPATTSAFAEAAKFDHLSVVRHFCRFRVSRSTTEMNTKGRHSCGRLPAGVSSSCASSPRCPTPTSTRRTYAAGRHCTTQRERYGTDTTWSGT